LHAAHLLSDVIPADALLFPVVIPDGVQRRAGPVIPDGA
jgi:hypothetical protein